MTETLSVYTERVDDIPLLLHQMQHLRLAEDIDNHLRPHGNRRGLSYGWLACLWLTHILSQADHRMNHVRGWLQQRLHTLQRLMPIRLVETDCTDDRLADLLRALSDDDAWKALETDLNRRTLAVYALPTERVRIDTTTVSLDTTPEGLFLLGHSKDHRPDLAQIKVLLATLDPLALPLVTQILPGNAADDPQYLPAVEQVRACLDKRGLLYVGDCKMAAVATRAGIASGQDFYLCPLSASQMPPEQIAALLQPVWQGQQPLENVERADANGEIKTIALGFEWTQSQQTDGFAWQERRLLVRSLAFAAAAERGLEARLATAQQQLADLTRRGKGRRVLTDAATAQQAVDTILARNQVDGLLQVSLQEQQSVRSVRGYGGKPARQEPVPAVCIATVVDSAAVAAAKAVLGWRVYATNASWESLSLPEAVLAYRDEYRIEHDFSRLKGHPLSVSPLYVSRQDHAKGLVRLLTLGLRVLCLLEFGVRSQLSQQNARLAGLYAGNPTRTTTMPTAERLLEAFQNITLTVIVHNGQHLCHLSSLTPLQRRVLELMDIGPYIYTCLLDDSPEPVPELSEP
jgi:transposase